jgi:hypothetical protein
VSARMSAGRRALAAVGIVVAAGTVILGRGLLPADAAAATDTASPSSNNTVTITFPATSQHYWRVTITANTGWPAGQISEFQIWNQ